MCGGIADDDGTLTKCSECRHDNAELILQSVPPSMKNQSDLLPWIYSRMPGNLATLLPKGSRRVVDLFAGSGRFARSANRRGFNVIYNDVHPLLAAYTTAVRDRMHGELNLVTSEMAMDIVNFGVHYRGVYNDPTNLLEAAATARIAAFNVPRACRLNETKTIKFAPLANSVGGREWANMDVSCMDYREAIATHDRSSTTFFVDCPYPGTSYYENNLSWKEFAEMLRLLRSVKGRVLMVLPTQRRTVKMVADAGFRTYLRLIKTPRFKGRDLVASSYPLKKDGTLEEFTPESFGIGPRDDLDETVQMVLDAVGQFDKPITRKQIEEHIGDSDPSVWGAISRARAEERLVRIGRGKYTTPEKQQTA